MYSLVSAMGKPRSIASRWQSIEIGDQLVAAIYSQYEKVFAILTNSFIAIEVCLDMDDVKAKYLASTLTFNQWLQSLGNESLPTTTDIPEIKTKHAIYSDAFRARFKIDAINPNTSTSAVSTRADKTWLSLTKPGIDYQLLYKSCLASVNGLFHLTDTDGQKLMVVDGMKSCRQSGRNELGLYSFREVGSLEFTPIKPEMIHKRYEGIPYANYLYIDIGVQKPNKTAMLVLGGYLHVLDNKTFARVSDTIYSICFDNFPLMDRYFESVGLIDLKGLGLEHIPDNPALISKDQLYSDGVLVKYATLPQSFLVFCDNPALFVEREALQETQIPNIYISSVEPKYPLITGVGKLSDFWRVKEHGQYALTISQGSRDFYNFNTTLSENLEAIDNARVPFKPSEYARAHFLKVGSDLFYPDRSV
jgi:hypothetical protein